MTDSRTPSMVANSCCTPSIFHRSDCRARKRGKDNAAKRVAERVAVARVQRINLVNALKPSSETTRGLDGSVMWYSITQS
jgi:hypothetical protein